MNLTVIIILLVGLVVSASICIILRNLVKAAIAMALTSAVLAIIMFILNATLAAAFELSVCAGLIPVIFISATNMTKVKTQEELSEMQKERNKRFFLLPVLLIVLLAAMLFILWPYIDASIPSVISQSGATAQEVIWGKRQVDLLGQIIIILVGVYGVIIFFKESDMK